MKAFNNDPKIKEFFVNRMNAHAEADEIVQGTGWEDGKGCFIGCTFNDYEHSKFESEGIGPEWLAHLADRIFEGLPNDRAKDFAKNFYPSIKVGIDLEQVKKDFLIFILEQNLSYLDACDYDKKAWPQVTDSIEKTKKAIELCIRYQKSGVDRESAESAARSAAWSTAESIASAASAAWSAESAVFASSTESTAESIAASATWSARSASWSARSTESAAFEQYADKLLELLKGDDQIAENQL